MTSNLNEYICHQHIFGVTADICKFFFEKYVQADNLALLDRNGGTLKATRKNVASTWNYH